MLDKVIGNPRLAVMERALDGAMLRQKVIANNLANVDTPGFKAVEVTFEEQLKSLVKGNEDMYPLRTSHPRHLQVAGSPSFNVGMKVLDGYTYRNDGNTVDVDREVARLAKNVVYYNAVSSSLNQELRILRMAITGGRG